MPKEPAAPAAASSAAAADPALPPPAEMNYTGQEVGVPRPCVLTGTLTVHRAVHAAVGAVPLAKDKCNASGWQEVITRRAWKAV